MFITDELISGTFTITAEGKTYTGTTEVLPENFFDGNFGTQYNNDCLNEICEEQDFSFTADDVTDWEISPS